MSDGYLSRDRAHLAALQRKRRARMVRIDYMPDPEALAAIEAKRATLPEWGGLSTNSATIDAIVTEWAELTGINTEEVEPPKSPANLPELPSMYAQARMSPADFPPCKRTAARNHPVPLKRAEAHRWPHGWRTGRRRKLGGRQPAASLAGPSATGTASPARPRTSRASAAAGSTAGAVPARAPRKAKRARWRTCASIGSPDNRREQPQAASGWGQFWGQERALLRTYGLKKG